jgi:hypothetical protein
MKTPSKSGKMVAGPDRDGLATFRRTQDQIRDRVLQAARMVTELRDKGGSMHLRGQLVGVLAGLRDDLLQHFAREEEGLYPYVRERLPKASDVARRLAATHDQLATAIVRLADRAWVAAVEDDFDEFATGYAQHERDEAAFLAELEGCLNEEDRSELAKLTRGL